MYVDIYIYISTESDLLEAFCARICVWMSVLQLQELHKGNIEEGTRYRLVNLHIHS